MKLIIILFYNQIPILSIFHIVFHAIIKKTLNFINFTKQMNYFCIDSMRKTYKQVRILSQIYLHVLKNCI